MITLFKITSWKSLIDEVKATKITEKCFYDEKGDRHFLHSEFKKHFKSKEEAVAWRHAEYEKTVKYWKDKIKNEEENLAEFNKANKV